MQPLKYIIAGLALAGTIAVSEPASASTLTYDVSGTFKRLSGSYYSALSGGSFTGTFLAPSNTFPLAPSTYDYLHNFQINLYTANGSLFSTLSSSTSGSYLAISDNYLNIYGGEQITFVANGTNYLQLVVPVTFNGTGHIIPGVSTSYAEVGTNYAYLATGNVAAVPEASTWAMLLLGFAGIGFVAHRRKVKQVSIAFRPLHQIWQIASAGRGALRRDD
jgi:hypothetical protein